MPCDFPHLKGAPVQHRSVTNQLQLNWCKQVITYLHQFKHRFIDLA